MFIFFVEGIGSIPDSVLSKLGNHKDLGVHSEMFSVGLVDLMKNGAVTNNNKKSNKGLTVGSFMIGTQKLYDYVNNNPAICEYLALSTTFVNTSF